jgi:hypothetical protein
MHASGADLDLAQGSLSDRLAERALFGDAAERATRYL